MEINAVLKSQEGKTLEFKRDTSALKQIMRTIVAFANTAGGIIIIGLDDNGNVIGVSDPLAVEEQLASSIADSIAPLIIPDIEIVTVEQKALVCIRVSHWPGPFYIKREGEKQGVYVRLGSSTRRASPEFIAELLRQQNNKTFDQLPCPSYSLDALDLPYLRNAFKETGRNIKEQQLVSLGILTPFSGRNVVTHGGLILFGKPEIKQQVLPDVRISCARFRDTGKSHFLDSLELEGGVFEALDVVPGFIQRNSRLLSKITGMKREDLPAYPDFAIREILVNSIAHCDYSVVGMRITVAVFSDRIEIQNPGILPFGMTLEDFKSGHSKIRNRVIVRSFRELRVMEQWGSGYKRICDFCNEYGYPIPEWQEIGMALRVTLFPHPEVEEITPQVTPHVTPHVERLLPLCRKPAGREQLQNLLGIKDRKHFYKVYLKPALQNGFIEYTLPEKPKSKFQQYRLTQLGIQKVQDFDKQ